MPADWMVCPTICKEASTPPSVPPNVGARGQYPQRPLADRLKIDASLSSAWHYLLSWMPARA